MITLERAQLMDAAIICDINIQAFNDEMNRVLGRDGGPPGYNTIEEHERVIKEFIAYRVCYQGETIGSFFLRPLGDAHCELESFCIYPEFQGRGFGYKTLEVMEAAHPDIKKWTLTNMKGSDRIKHLYEKFGFKQIAEEEWFYIYEKTIL